MADKPADQDPSIEEILASIRQIISDEEDESGGDTAAPAEPEKAAPKEEATKPEPEPEPETKPEPEPEPEDDILDLTDDMAQEEDDAEDQALAASLAEESDAEDEIDFAVLGAIEDNTADAEDDSDIEPPPPPMEIDMQEAEPPAPAEPPPVPVKPPPPKEPEPDYTLDEDFMDHQEASTERADKGGSDILSGAAREAALSSLSKLKGRTKVYRDSSGRGVSLEDIVRDLLHPMLKEWMDEHLPHLVERLVEEELDKLARDALDD